MPPSYPTVTKDHVREPRGTLGCFLDKFEFPCPRQWGKYRRTTKVPVLPSSAVGPALALTWTIFIKRLTGNGPLAISASHDMKGERIPPEASPPAAVID